MNLKLLFSLILICLSFLLLLSCNVPNEIPLFDGKTLSGWEGDTTKTWKVVNGAIVGGSLTEDVPHNDFLCTTQSYDNFVLKLKFKLEGNGGFINAGVQFRSKRAAAPSYEMIGYQADMGDKYYGALYDESRRDVVLAGVDSITSAKIVKHGEWNDYEIRADKQHIQIFLNRQQTVDYQELDPQIPQSGLIGLQVHGGGKALVSFKDIVIRKID
ncbi:MAG: DUF1080 domain-containing protein [Thermoflexibacter sp.]|jgi:hypothetical protein|nr:DUF1080 domain-containing protein [Thermoflexibacter sp.]